MKKYKAIIILINLILLLGFLNTSIFQKETLLSEGRTILLELAPVDPRSLMQGDYMQLRYAISDPVTTDSIDKRGFCVIRVNENGIGELVRLQSDRLPLSNGELLIEYTAAKWNGINIGAESYFFQEGDATRYEDAKYGGLKVDHKGNSLLIGLYNDKKEKI